MLQSTGLQRVGHNLATEQQQQALMGTIIIYIPLREFVEIK